MNMKTSLLIALIVLIISVSVVGLFASDVILNKCHKFCAKNYPETFEDYKVCMDGYTFGATLKDK